MDQSHWSGFRSCGLASFTSVAVGPCAAARTGRVGRGQPCPGRGKAALGAPWGRPPLGLAPGDAAAALGRASPIAFLNRPPPLLSQRAPALRAGKRRFRSGTSGAADGHGVVAVILMRERSGNSKNWRHRGRGRALQRSPLQSPHPHRHPLALCCGRASAAGSDASFSLAGPATNELGGATAAAVPLRPLTLRHTSRCASGPFCAAGGVRPVGLGGRSGGLGGCCRRQNPDLGPR